MAAPWARGAEVRVIGKLQGQDCINVWHFATNTVVNDGGPLDALLLALAQAMLACAIDTLLPGVTSEYTLVGVEARSIHPALSDPVVSTAPAGSVGQLGPTSASFLATLVNLRTGGGGRRGRGKKFLPPPGESNIAVSAIDQPTLDLLIAYLECVASKFFTGTGTEDWEVGVYSKTNDLAVGGTFDNSFRVVTQMTPSQFIAKMGTRKVGRGS